MLFRKLCDEGVIIFIVEYDMDLVMNLVDCLVVMNSGQEFVQGSLQQVCSNLVVCEVYLGVEV